jgi:UDP:flavonoid glycosyltransferase YjiC (YdhE family)
VLTALAHGVPVVCAPIGSDHFQVARLVERAGAGLTRRWDRDELVWAALEAAADPRFAANARVVAAQVARMPSVREVAALLEARFGSS